MTVQRFVQGRRVAAMIVAVSVLGAGAAQAGQLDSPAAPADAAAAEGQTVLASVSSAEVQGNRGTGYEVDISAAGDKVVFFSDATNLVAGDTNQVGDIFVRDLATGTTQRASVSTGGVQANAESVNGVISADGRMVAFASNASNLVPGDTNGRSDVFVHDLVTGETSRVSVSSSGEQGNWSSSYPSISADHRLVTFSSTSRLAENDHTSNEDVYVRNLATARTLLTSVTLSRRGANGSSVKPAISPDGRYVAFISTATNLLGGNPAGTNVFVRDRWAQVTRRVSVRINDGAQDDTIWGVSVSALGREVAYSSDSSDLVAHDTNDRFDVFVWEASSGATRRVSVGPPGQRGGGYYPDLSANGRFVAYSGDGTDVVPGHTSDNPDILVRDRREKTTRLVSLTPTGDAANGWTWGQAISDDGNTVAFASQATNLVADDANGPFADVYVHTSPAG